MKLREKDVVNLVSMQKRKITDSMKEDSEGQETGWY